MAADGTLKITDFGLARRLDMVSTETAGKFLGTPSYAAPEQAGASRGVVGPATDIYGTGRNPVRDADGAAAVSCRYQLANPPTGGIERSGLTSKPGRGAA